MLLLTLTSIGLTSLHWVSARDIPMQLWRIQKIFESVDYKKILTWTLWMYDNLLDYVISSKIMLSALYRYDYV